MESRRSSGSSTPEQQTATTSLPLPHREVSHSLRQLSLSDEHQEVTTTTAPVEECSGAHLTTQGDLSQNETASEPDQQPGALQTENNNNNLPTLLQWALRKKEDRVETLERELASEQRARRVLVKRLREAEARLEHQVRVSRELERQLASATQTPQSYGGLYTTAGGAELGARRAAQIAGARDGEVDVGHGAPAVTDGSASGPDGRGEMDLLLLHRLLAQQPPAAPNALWARWQGAFARDPLGTLEWVNDDANAYLALMELTGLGHPDNVIEELEATDEGGEAGIVGTAEDAADAGEATEEGAGQGEEVEDAYE